MIKKTHEGYTVMHVLYIVSYSALCMSKHVLMWGSVIFGLMCKSNDDIYLGILLIRFY